MGGFFFSQPQEYAMPKKKEVQDEDKRQKEQLQEQKERKDGGQGAKPGQTDQARNRDTGHTGNR